VSRQVAVAVPVSRRSRFAVDAHQVLSMGVPVWGGRPSWAAMSDDGSRPSSSRRPRAVEKKVLPAGPMKDLRDVIYRLYAEADRPQLAELAQQIAGDDDLPGLPSCRRTPRRASKRKTRCSPGTYLLSESARFER
jgi:hypothetical protein